MAWRVPANIGDLESQPPTRGRAVLLIQYLAVIVVAEMLLVFASLSNNELLVFIAVLLEVFLVLGLLAQASLVATKDRSLAAFLGALILVPLLRVVSLSTPFTPFTIIEWLAIVSVPLLLAAAAVMRAQGLRPRDVFLGAGDRRYLAVNITLIPSGFLLGLLEYQLLRPEPWIATPDFDQLVFAAIVVFLATGLAEELIFRGILLGRGIRLLGRPGALLYVTIVFAALHIGFMSAPHLLLAFLIGLLFGLAVLLTGSLWGAVGAHALANVALYLILPFGF